MTTATEIQMLQEQGIKRQAAILDQIRNKWLVPMIDWTFVRICGGPRRKRWDKFGAYYRRQLKKWMKKNKLEIRI